MRLSQVSVICKRTSEIDSVLMKLHDDDLIPQRNMLLVFYCVVNLIDISYVWEPS